jgi:hypothetical protein
MRAAAAKRAAAAAAAKKARPAASKPRSAPKAKAKPSNQRRPADRNDRKDSGDSGDPSSCESNSFLPRTSVLLADGRRVRIDQVKVGDRVVATDGAGESSARTVVATSSARGRRTWCG